MTERGAMEDHAFLKERFDELREELRELRKELMGTRHALKGSVETMAIVQAEHVVELRNHASRADRIEEMLHQHAKEHEGRLRVMEDIATSMREIPRRVEASEEDLRRVETAAAEVPRLDERVKALETSSEKMRTDIDAKGRFTWGDLYRAAGAIAAVAAVIAFLLDRT